MNLLLVIDLQNAFINENTISSIKDIENLVNSNKYDKVLFTRFVNSLNNPVYTKLKYDGCIEEESKKICIDTKDNKVIDKNTYSAYNQELIDYIKSNNIKNIYLCGIDVECCVLITALNLFENNYNVYVLKDYVYCMAGDKVKNEVINILKFDIGDNYII